MFEFTHSRTPGDGTMLDLYSAQPASLERWATPLKRPTCLVMQTARPRQGHATRNRTESSSDTAHVSMGVSEPGATMCTAPLKWTRMKTSAQAGLLDVIRVLKGT